MIIEQPFVDYKESFNLLFNQIEDCLLILDKTGRIIQMNKAALEILELTLDEILNFNLEQLYPLTKRVEQTEIVKGMLEGDMSTCLLSLCTKSGEIITLTPG